jgi:hypothetical protein
VPKTPKNHFGPKSSLTPKALSKMAKNGLCCFGQVLVIKKCDMIFWEFYGK